MFYNPHIHVFTDDDAPDHFLPLTLVKVLKTKSGERKFGLDLRAFLGEELFHTIAYENTERFLGIRNQPN